MRTRRRAREREPLQFHRGSQRQLCQRRNPQSCWAKDGGRRLFLRDTCLHLLQCRLSEVDLQTSPVPTTSGFNFCSSYYGSRNRFQCLEEDQVDHGKSLYILRPEYKRPLNLSAETGTSSRRRLISRVRRHLNQHRVDIVHRGEPKLLLLWLLKILLRLVIPMGARSEGSSGRPRRRVHKPKKYCPCCNLKRIHCQRQAPTLLTRTQEIMRLEGTPINCGPGRGPGERS